VNGLKTPDNQPIVTTLNHADGRLYEALAVLENLIGQIEGTPSKVQPGAEVRQTLSLLEVSRNLDGGTDKLMSVIQRLANTLV